MSDSTPDNELVSIAEALAQAADGTPDHTEAAYRRGVHQALAFAADRMHAQGWTAAGDDLAAACNEAGVLRHSRDGGHGALLDELQRRLADPTPADPAAVVVTTNQP